MADFKIKSTAGTGNKTLIQGQDQSDSNYAIQIGDAGASTLHNATITAWTPPVNGIVGMKGISYNGAQISKGTAGAHTWEEIHTGLRITYEAQSTSNKLFFSVNGFYISTNDNSIHFGRFYNVTDTAVVNEPPAQGSRQRCHWAQRVRANDDNDFHTMTFNQWASAPSGSKVYTVQFAAEGTGEFNFCVSTLSSASGATAPITFTVTEIKG